jgi:hypothetical protein
LGDFRASFAKSGEETPLGKVEKEDREEQSSSSDRGIGLQA